MKIIERSDKKLIFENFIEKTRYEIKKEAILQKALTYKITEEIINKKLNSQMNCIKYGIKRINPKFNEKSKHYIEIKEQVLDSMNRFEESLIKLGNFYDLKIEQLILRRFELQIKFIGFIVKQEAFNNMDLKEKSKSLSKIKDILKIGIKKAIDTIKLQKKENQINIVDIQKLKDKEQVNKEQSEYFDNNINKVLEQMKKNNEEIEKINKEIYLISTEIKRMNERKKEALNYAMESEDKWVLANVKKPRTFEKITRFFASKINTPKVILKTIINPFNEKIDSFNETELANID